jgi:branched-chain amino acid transport system ATP-binding protein
MTALLEVRDLSKRFGGVQANDRVSFDVEEGSILGVLGPNGAGKTTLFNCVTGFLRPEAGTVRFAGHDITARSPSAIARAGLVRTFQIVRVFPHLTAFENVVIGALLRARSVRLAQDRAREMLDDVGLASRAEIRARDLTMAERKRLELARALATGPRILLLDEPMSGLTPREVSDAVSLVRRLRERGLTIVLVEHVLEVVMPLAEHVLVLDHGRTIAEGTPAEVSRDPEVVAAYLGRRFVAES